MSKNVAFLIFLTRIQYGCSIFRKSIIISFIFYFNLFPVRTVASRFKYDGHDSSIFIDFFFF